MKSNNKPSLSSNEVITLETPSDLFVTDPEGDEIFWRAWRGFSDKLSNRFRFVYGGDISGSRGSYALGALYDIRRVYQTIDSEFESDPGPGFDLDSVNHRKPVLIAGNRDDNRLRFLTELASQDFLDHFCAPEARQWMGVEAGLLADFDLTEDQYKSLTVAQKRVHVVKWMLAKTMGAATEFEYRRDELARLRGEVISDEQVAQSFIEEMCDDQLLEQLLPENSRLPFVLPEQYRGLALWYIQHSNLYALNQNERILYSHSAYQTGDCPAGVTTKEWVVSSNAERRDNIKDLLARVSAQAGRLTLETHYGRQHSAIISSLPRGPQYPNNRQSQNFYNAYSVPGQEVILPAGVKLNISGHQPVLQIMPMVLRDASNNMAVINADTSNPIPGGQHKPAVIQVNPDASFIIKSADGLQEINSYDPLIGKILDDGMGRALHVSSVNTETGQYHLNCYEKPVGKPFYSITFSVCMDKSAVESLQPIRKNRLKNIAESDNNPNCFKFARLEPAEEQQKGVSDISNFSKVGGGSPGRKV